MSVEEVILDCLAISRHSASGLVWCKKPHKFFNNRLVGLRAGRKTGSGWQVHSVSAHFQAHRVIWEKLNGPIPVGQVIDHIDGDPFNNNPDNLRLATVEQNAQNAKTRKDNKSGYKNVYFHKKSGKYLVGIQCKGKRHEFWSWDTPEEANEVAILKRKELHKNFNSDNRGLNNETK